MMCYSRRLCLILASILVAHFAGCASKETRQLQYGEIAPRGEKLLEITSATTDGFYRGAFEMCRHQQPPLGFKLEQPPSEVKASGWGLKGLVRCEGDLDPALNLRYQ